MKPDADGMAGAEGAPDESSAVSEGLDPPRPHRYGVLVGLAVTAFLIVLDQVTKQVAESVLEHREFVPLLGDSIGWQLIYNPGGAFGMPLPSWLFLVVTVVVLVLVLRWLPRATSLIAATSYGMLLAGAVGNVLDRLFRAGDPGFGNGHVVDFVAWGSFPRFNVADSAITVGFVLLVISLLLEERRAKAAEAAAELAVAHGADSSVAVEPGDVSAPADRPDAGDPEGSDVESPGGSVSATAEGADADAQTLDVEAAATDEGDAGRSRS